MAYDATKMKDWEIAEAAEQNMPTPEEWQKRLELQKDEVIPYGRISNLDFLKIIDCSCNFSNCLLFNNLS